MLLMKQSEWEKSPTYNQMVGVGRNTAKPLISLRMWSVLAPAVLTLAFVGIWQLLLAVKVLPHTMFPSPSDVVQGFQQEIRSNRLPADIIASLWRVAAGFALSIALGLPAGVALGSSPYVRAAFLPGFNFLRNLSPLAWIGFAIVWFGVGDAPAIFLIFMSIFFPIALSVSADVAAIPVVYQRVADEYGLSRLERLLKVTLPAIMPRFVTTLRVAMGVAWLVVVAAEMVAGHNGLGFAIYDDRNALRQDLLVVHMIVIGVIGVLLDRFLASFAKNPSLQWGFQRQSL